MLSYHQSKSNIVLTQSIKNALNIQRSSVYLDMGDCTYIYHTQMYIHE